MDSWDSDGSPEVQINSEWGMTGSTAATYDTERPETSIFKHHHNTTQILLNLVTYLLEHDLLTLTVIFTLFS